MICSTNSDCESSPSKPVCKETIPGGSKICQKPSSCSKGCLPGDYCAATNICRMGEPKTGKIHNTYLHDSAIFFQCLALPPPNVLISETGLCAENLPTLEGKPARNQAKVPVKMAVHLENFVQQKTNVMKVNISMYHGNCEAISFLLMCL